MSALPSLAFAGIGLMGLPMCRRLLAAGFPLTVWNRSADKCTPLVANGARIAFVAAGASSTHVGQEIDVQVSRALTPQLLLAAGYAYMMPGAFLKQATPGQSLTAPYLMATYTFLAEK